MRRSGWASVSVRASKLGAGSGSDPGSGPSGAARIGGSLGFRVLGHRPFPCDLERCISAGSELRLKYRCHLWPSSSIYPPPDFKKIRLPDAF